MCVIRKAVREGFANFLSVSACFNGDASDPVYCGPTASCRDVESATALADTVYGEEESVTQFFWDLRDSRNDGGSELDSEQWTFQETRNVGLRHRRLRGRRECLGLQLPLAAQARNHDELLRADGAGSGR
jgi:hypothetical protein